GCCVAPGRGKMDMMGLVMAATDRAIRVGGVMPLSRPGFLEAGRHLKAGLELAVADVNGLGGVGGRPLELLVRDTGAGPAEAMAIVDELHEDAWLRSQVSTTASSHERSLRGRRSSAWPSSARRPSSIR